MSSASPLAAAAAAASASSAVQPPSPVGGAAHDLASNTHTLPVSDPAADTLAQFLSRPAVLQRFASACSSYERAVEELDAARAARDKFVAACTKHLPATSLPPSLQLRLVTKAKLTPVAGSADFYGSELATLQQIEKEASTRIYDTLKQAKDKHVAHLQSQCNAHAFLHRSQQEHRQFVSAFAADYDAAYGSPPASSTAEAASAAASASSSASSSSFPLEAAVADFVQRLQSHISAHLMQGVDARRAEFERKQRAAAEESKAQETVLAGAHTGQTIAMVAERTVAKRVAPLQKQVQQLQKQQQQRAGSHTGKHRRDDSDHDDANLFADTDNPGITVSKNRRTVTFDRRPPSTDSGRHLPSKAAHRQPTNGEGGDRRQRPRKEATSDRAATTRGRGKK